MSYRLLSVLILSVIVRTLSGADTITDTVLVAPFGKVHIYKPSGTPSEIIIMISGDGGWKFGVVGFSEKFAGMGALVAGVDILRYNRELRRRTGECYSVASDFVELATALEKKYNFPEYQPAILMGYSSGATLVFGILAQARAGTFKGGISLGFCPDIELPKMLCQVNGLKVTSDPSGKKFYVLPDSRLGNPWIVLNGKLDRICTYSEVADFIGKTADAELVTLPNVGHGFAKWSDFMPQWVDAYQRLLKKYRESAMTKPDERDLKALPLVITPAKAVDESAPAAVFISGDGGWYWFEQSIADSLARTGIPTIGIDSKKYLWKRRSPEEAAKDIAAALTYYCNTWKKDRIIFIGYSLGAEILPFVINRLPEELRTEITSAVLLSPGLFTDFEIHISNMLGLGSSHNTYDVTQEINRMKTGNILCIFGKDEDTKLPDEIKNAAVKVRTVPGDHHYKNNLALIVRTMRENKVASALSLPHSLFLAEFIRAHR